MVGVAGLEGVAGILVPEDGELVEEEPLDGEGLEREDGAFVVPEGWRPFSSSKEMVPSSLKEDSQATVERRADAMSPTTTWTGRMRDKNMSRYLSVGW